MSPISQNVLAPSVIRRAIGGKYLCVMVACVIKQVVTENMILIRNMMIDAPIGIETAGPGRIIRIIVQRSRAVVRKWNPFLENGVRDRIDPAGRNLVVGER